MSSPELKTRRSIPAQKARSPVPVSTTARISGSGPASMTVPPMARTSPWVGALRAAGRLGRATST